MVNGGIVEEVLLPLGQLDFGKGAQDCKSRRPNSNGSRHPTSSIRSLHARRHADLYGNRRCLGKRSLAKEPQGYGSAVSTLILAPVKCWVSATLVLWRTRGEHKSLVGEFAFQVKFARKRDVGDQQRELAAQFYINLQHNVKEWLALGVTKTAMVYRLNGNEPQSHE